VAVPPELLRRAASRDERAFVELTAPHRDALHRHCYRLLGSLHDADDALQETLLRAWQAIDGYEPRAPLASWLYRIATNVSLRALERRGRSAGIAHLEPYPDAAWHAAAAAPGADAVAESRELIGLAYVAAVQLLPPRQRVVLVLRDCLGWPARDVAELLDDSVASVNSALQRARRTLAASPAPAGAAHAHASEAATADVLRRFVEAWEAVDVPALVALLRDDAVLVMPPEDVRVEGAEAIGGFFATQPLAGRLDRIPLRVASANGQPALAAYADEDGAGVATPYGVMVLALDGPHVAAVVGFPRRPDLFARLGLPPSIDGP
jgi:RNA polymerase sigma-70 factor (ECF subfamily)